jgi:hypothetical protein
MGDHEMALAGSSVDRREELLGRGATRLPERKPKDSQTVQF